MKKIISCIMIFAIAVCSMSQVFAVEPYTFDLSYNGSIVKNEEKQAIVVLTGVEGTPYANALIKVKIEGPATPELLATDSLGNQVNIAQTGYWGPVEGFPIGGSFINTTVIKATFPEEGTYTITLSLVDVANNNAVITSKAFTLEVYEDQTPIVNNVVVPEELPKTGTSVFEYVLYTIGIVLVLSMVGVYLRSRRTN